MSWWREKLVRHGLRYGLSRTGLLEDDAIDRLDVDIAVGKQNVIELKDVALNVQRIARLARLPPALRVEAARVRSLRLVIPADFYRASIVAEVDGIEIRATLHAQTPPHRKRTRRLHSPPPERPGGLDAPHAGLRLPGLHDVAQSFLMHEPLADWPELDALAHPDADVAESVVSESSDADVGTGHGVGVPGFLATFLQGIVDRFRLEVRNLHVRLDAEMGEEQPQSMPVVLSLRVGSAELHALRHADPATPGGIDMRRFRLDDIAVDLLSSHETLAALSGLPRCASPSTDKSPTESPRSSVNPAGRRPSATHTTRSSGSASTQSWNSALRPIVASKNSLQPSPQPLPQPQPQPQQQPQPQPQPSPPPPLAPSASLATADTDHFLDARDLDEHDPRARPSDLDIHPGDDNISWGSRRSKTSAPADDLWNSVISDEHLPESLILEPQRAHTPRASSTRSNSPFAVRQRRPVSPYSRSIRSPGSWPRPDDSPERTRFTPSPGSWPMLGRSRHPALEPLDKVLKSAGGVEESITSGVEQDTRFIFADDAVDNKHSALEGGHPRRSIPRTPPEQEGVMDESMLASQYFSHEEAQSMYMSAMSGSPKIDMPGGWASPAQSARSSSPEVARLPTLDEVLRQDQHLGSDGAQESREARSGNATPRAQTPPVPCTPPPPPAREPDMPSWQIVHISAVEITLPASSSTTTDGPPAVDATHSRRAGKPVSSSHGMPGTFSAYSDMSRFRLEGGAKPVSSDTNSVVFNPEENSPSSESDSPVDVSLGTACMQIDLPIVRILYALSTRIFRATQKQEKTPAKPPSGRSQSSRSGPVGIHLDHAQLCFRDQVDRRRQLQFSMDPSSRGAVDLSCDDVDLRIASDTNLRIGDFSIGLGGKDLLVFDRSGGGVADSPIMPWTAPVIAVQVSQNRMTATGRPVIDVDVQTAPLVCSVDLSTMEETFESFGGLSGMLELGNSMLSESITASPTGVKPAKGVRFAQEPQPIPTGSEVKANGEIGGLTATLRGPACAVALQTSTVRTVYREQGTVATISRILLTGPHLDDQPAEPPLSIDLASLKIEYLAEPKDVDLERLLSLLTPSKDKYENDGDIIIDTLLGQRRKGALLRSQIGDVKANVGDWGALSTLTALGDDLSKLSAVTKYLPEDDKPGLLTTLRVKQAEAQLPVNERFGKIGIDLHDLHLAHVGIPALLAFSVGSLFASQIGGPQIIHPQLPPAGLDGAPVIMARLLGDDFEPTIKLKLYNLCVEYSVPVILDLTGVDTPVQPEVLVNELVQSVASLAVAETARKLPRSPASDVATMKQKEMVLDLLVHDSAVGLTPQRLSSKVVVVLSDAHLSTAIPPAETMTAKLELRKAAIYVTDRWSADSSDPPRPTRVSSIHTNTTQRLASSLITQGFVSVGSIMAAEVAFRAKDSDRLQGAKSVEVDVKNELFLLETCADSTQTLIATLGALAPPAPPSPEPKFLTQPMRIEDMMASFTGDPFVQPDGPPETIFDVDEPPGDDDLESRLGISTLDDEETNELLAESELTSSLYGPISGVFGTGDDVADQESTGGDYPETAESLLEGDPFEMTLPAPDARLGDDALMSELRKQCKPAPDQEPAELGLYELEELGGDGLAGGQQDDLPFRLRLRDFHVIWHIYDGYDWQRTRDGIVEAVEQVELRAEERRARHRRSLQDRDDDESVIGDFLFNSIYIGVPAGHDAQELRRQINRNIDEDVSETASVPGSGISRPTTQYSASGQPRQRARRRLKLGRSKAHKIAFELKGVSADVRVMGRGSGHVVSSVDLRLGDFEIFDKVPSSTWRKFLTHLDSDPAQREMCKPMIHIALDHVKTLESHSASEIVLHVSVLPLRLHVDQDALDFITRFFEFEDAEVRASSEAGEQPFLQRVEVDTVDMCLDYKPKNVDYAGIRSGKTTEFMNLVTLEGCHIRLKHAIVYGLRGFDALHPTLNDIWMPDVKRHQLPRVLAGLAPVRSLVNLGSGVRDVIAIPVKEYQKDGRVVRSIQKGAFHFGKTTASELARLGAKVALGTQTMLTRAEGVLSPEAAAAGSTTPRRRAGSHDVPSDEEEREVRAVSAYANQPSGVLSGLRSARRHLEHDLLTAKDALIAVQGDVRESRGPGGAAAAVVKHAPTLILRPVIGATRAVGTTLLGVGNQIDRENLRRVDDKYKRR